MEFQWAVVYFPHAEFSICEDAGALNVVVQRTGNANISSYVTISAIEQTAKEGLDYVSRRVSKIQFDPGKVEAVWKIVIIKDNLEEAPIEQLQVTLSDPENCIIVNHNRTIISIYDLNRGSCSQIPAWDSQDHKLLMNNHARGNEDSEEGNVDKESDIRNDISFPLECNQNIYGLLHFETNSQILYQCDGEKWFKWYAKVPDIQFNLETFPPDPLEVSKTSTTEITEGSTLETFITTEGLPISSISEADSCIKGWQQFTDKCYKFIRPSSTWDDAKAMCKTYPSGDLALIESFEHNNWLVQLARSKPFWIGLHASWESNDWSYFNSNDAPFMNWKKGFPRLPNNGEMKHRCVLVRGSGLWINKNCDGHGHSFICSILLNGPDDSMVSTNV